MKRRPRPVTMLLMAGALAASPTRAQEADTGKMSVEVTPYLWAAGFGGTVRPFPGAPAFAVSRSFGELLNDLDAAFFLSGSLRKGRFVAVGDISHSASSRDGLVPTPIPGVPLVPAQGALRQTSATMLGGWRVVDTAGVSIDLLAGVRAFWLRASVASAPLGLQRSPGLDFVDPIVAARVDARLADGWSVRAYGDVGGVGVGSKFTTQGVLTVNARVAPRLWLSGGYRALVVDYDGNGARADVSLGGPLLGATLAF